MKGLKKISIVLLCCALAVNMKAQVSLDIQFEQQHYLRNESLPVKIRLTNLSGQPLKIGETADWLTFSLQNREGKVIPQAQDIVAGGQFELESAGSVTKIIDLNIGYDLNSPGSYRVTAIARFPQLKLDVSSRTQTFDIVRGTTLWEQVCGVPPTNRPPESIRFSLIEAYYLKQLKLYVRAAEDPEGPWVHVLPLGPIVSFARPDKAIDSASVLHVLYQSGPRAFEYCQISPQGLLAKRSTFSLGSTKPRLKVNENGTIGVVGGIPTLDPTVVPSVYTPSPKPEGTPGSK